MSEQERIEEIEQSISALEAQRGVLGDAVVDPAVAALREKLEGLQPRQVSAQRKQVTVLFADVSGFTAMSETMDAEDVHDTLNALWTRLDGAITDQGGMIDKHIGDAVMALFGAPIAQEDDPERAIRAGLAMQAELATFREERGGDRSTEGSRRGLAMRIGINTGPVLLGDVGTTDEYTAMGDAVNLASRLEHAAPVGGILISHDTYRHVRGLFDVAVLEPLQVKGKVEPIQVYVVQRAKPRAFRVPTRGVVGIETRMVGRKGELGHLQDAMYAAVEDREAQVVTIVGEAGVGKSRLLYEFRNWLTVQPESARISVFQGRATPEMANLPYSLIRDLFAFRFEIRNSDPAAVARQKLEDGVVALLGAGDEENVERAHFIGQLIGFDFSESPHLRGVIGDPQQVHDRAFFYAVQLFRAVSEGRSAAIYLEDIHWADDGSLDLIDHLGRECGDLPLLIVALTRPMLYERRPLWGDPSALLGTGGQATHTRLDLRPLSKRDSRRLVNEVLQKVAEVPADLRDLIVRGSEGNPFYVEELIKVLIEDGVIVRGDDRWEVVVERLPEVRVPPTLTAVLQARLDGLPPMERETLQRASVVGRVFWESAVAGIGEATDAEDLSVLLETLQKRELVFGRETSAFVGTQEYIIRHAVLHEVTYESVLRRLRRIYHGQVAEWLVERGGERVGEYAGRIGEHYERAEMGPQAAEWYGRAGRQAQETYALETALDYYQKALAVEERWEWRKGQAEVLHVLGQRDEEQAVLQALEAASGARVFDVAYLWGQYHEAIGEYAQAQAAVERALAACRESGDVVHQVRCLSQLGLVARRQGDYERAKDWYNQALDLSGDQAAYSHEESQALAEALNGLGTVHRQQGASDQAVDCYERALAINRISGNRRGEANTLNALGVTAFYQRNLAKAEVHHRRALDIRRAIGDRAGEGESLFNLADAIREAGDYGQAQGYLSEALTIQQATGDRWEEGNTLNGLGVLYHQLGDLAQAQTCLQRGLELSQEIGDEAGQAYILANLGLVVRDEGDLEAAERLLGDGLTLAQAQEDRRLASYFLSYLGDVGLRAGKPDLAFDRASAALNIRLENQLRLLTTGDLTTMAAARLACGDAEQSLVCVDQALIILDECAGEGPEFPEHDYFICYQVLLAAGRIERAKTCLQSAYDMVIARADKITDPALRQSFLERVDFNREIVEEYESVMCET